MRIYQVWATRSRICCRDRNSRAPGIKGGKKALGGATPERSDEIKKLIVLYEKGAYRPLIDQVFPMSKIVEAHRHVDGGHKCGSVVIDMRTGT